MTSSGENQRSGGMGAFMVALFPSVSGSVRAEDILLGANIPVKLIPVPRHLSSDCGVCLRFEGTDEPRVTALLAKANLEVEAIHPI